MVHKRNKSGRPASSALRPSSAVGMGPLNTGTIVLDLADPEETGPPSIFCNLPGEGVHAPEVG
jgi:hypothetical protein